MRYDSQNVLVLIVSALLNGSVIQNINFKCQVQCNLSFKISCLDIVHMTQ